MSPEGGGSEGPKKIFTRTEATAQLLIEDLIETSQRLFHTIEKYTPEDAVLYRPHYDEFSRLVVEIVKEDPLMKNSLMDEIKKRSPRNLWVQLVERAGREQKPLTSDKQEVENEEFKESIKKRMKGEDIQ